MKHKKYLIFIIAVWAFLVFPFAGMLFWRSDETTENTELASFPELKTDEGWNQEYLSKMEAYFEDHFALRQYWVDVYKRQGSGFLFVYETDICICHKVWNINV